MTMQLRGKRKATREANLKLAEGLDDDKWIKATPYHWRRKLKDGSTIDFWPTTMKAQLSWFNKKEGCHELELVENSYKYVDAILELEAQGIRPRKLLAKQHMLQKDRKLPNG